MNTFEIITLILKLAGSLCMFLFGIKMMSDSLQKVAGSKMRSILYSMTSNRFKGVFTGILVTSVIQSSSASTVMVISFVNAGLMSLTAAIGVIMGANIGTTVTAWLISLLGFKVSMATLSLPLMGIALPFLFSKKDKQRSIGELIIGFGILFIGLEYLKTSIPDIQSNPEFFNFLGNLTNNGYWSILIFVLIGTILTIVLQSSSATMALTLVLCFNGILPFECGAAMVLGENIGTTITANIAALVGNISARRAAFAHTLFNLIGVIWMLIVFFPFLRGIDYFIVKSTGVSAFGDPNLEAVRLAIPIALSIFHTAFNLINTFILIWFTDSIAKLVTWVIKDKNSDESFRLKYITQGMMNTSELATIQAKKEIVFMAQQTNKMIVMLPQLLTTDNEKDLKPLGIKMDKYEEISDRMLLEISKYLASITKSSEVSAAVADRIIAMLKIIDEIERIADRCYQFYREISAKINKKITFNEAVTKELLVMVEYTQEAYSNMMKNLSEDYHKIDLAPGNNIEKKINEQRDDLRTMNAEMIRNNEISFEASSSLNEIFSTYERIGDIIQNVNKSIATVKE
ncbi:Na/Pi cotransporter family protein [Odoribacter sp. OttesenSCG-928-L07]|nr:Na/Pi cotransporter family protein [Odoribacter sp. OttesenSCG-928-L07]MDL2239570.1 Na/Pi cotransporter family protein [Bacteroidales bacterium OttesenSCG-928-L14]MDL2241047.1 Na/Pi cotransporter family protein [Bacteroidales bacterium OttesenSCG-928-K22]